MNSSIMYWISQDGKKMIKILTPTTIDFLIVRGRDLSLPFDHRHARQIFESSEDLNAAILDMTSSTATSWEYLTNEYLQVNKEKVAIMNAYRQGQYDSGNLR